MILVSNCDRMFVVYSSYLHLLDAVAAQCGIPFHSYVSDVSDDGDVLGGVELEVPVSKPPGVSHRRFFWASASSGFTHPHDEAALQALSFLQEYYGFVISDYNYRGMLAYRELARSALIFAASIVRTVGLNCVGSTGCVSDVSDAAHWQVLYLQMVSSACRF